jgi:integrase/recombinase XerC/integrase/recombinase XerD
MGAVHQLARRDTVTVGAAADAYLATLAGPESAGTRRVYSGVLRQLTAEYGTDADVAELWPDAVAEWFASRWGQRSPARWNTALDALCSACRYWGDQGWLTESPGAAPATPPQGP